MAIARILGFIVLALLWVAGPACSVEPASFETHVRSFFPQADEYGDFEGEPRAAPVYRDGTLIGYVFHTDDVVRIPAYSGRPINTLIGIDTQARITGLSIVGHEEPILAVGITEARLAQYTSQYAGKSAFDRIVIGAERDGHLAIDGISGATITVMVQNATVMRSARDVAEARGLAVAEAGESSSVAPGGAATGAASAAVGEAESGDKRTPLGTTGSDPSIASGSLGDPAVSAGFDRHAVRAFDAAPSLRSLADAMTGRWSAPGEVPMWVAVWHDRAFEIGVLLLGLAVLSFILIFQDWLARRPRTLTWVRNGFMLYTLFFIGWWGLAQLSVVNVLTFVNAITHEFRWENFLLDPMLFILWSFVAVTLLLWGRGVYCGWLCPFGALQELMLHVSRRLKLPVWEFSDAVHERLLALKYVILVVLFGLSLQSLAEAAVYAEVEPFKTAISMRFDREWPFVTYALALVVLSLFNRKFYCKYLCPLGAALAIPGHFRVFDWWLRRRRECGKPCQGCASRCSVRAIRPTGEINANECHHCLDCQVVYYNDKACVALVDRRKRREQRREQVKDQNATAVVALVDRRPAA
ncbi:MAG TPA: 4Fe-4S binding protein [Rhodocyclaceae bacterium]|nr:4Fe-4S binding protein [Rhodocyclaceae bacterium]